MSEYDIAYYKKINEEEKPQAERLADVLAWRYNPKSVLDVGCATGLYLRPFLDKNIDILGTDYSESTVADEVLQIPRKFIEISDITKKPLNKFFDLTLCIEVLEHIPENSAKEAIANITKTSDLIFFTAAQPGQGGVGHINCQPKQYWEKLFNNYDFTRDKQDENYIRIIMESGYRMGWLVNNMMIFKNQKSEK